ncbi:class I SAM-dependent methyltransferase [uncultured Croceitalea sp.]|uniref:class I SAM-dependent methyltransferase n=1 Tax=uncultured Croceitalea sp. TaxID=1798908 RepID=UPI0033059938
MKDNILMSWEENADKWIKTISENTIASRKYTNKAILDAVLKLKSIKIIDIGCGEGWLAKTLENQGKEVVGLDATAKLLEHAKSNNSGTFYQMTFEEIAQGKPIPDGPFAIAVFNFCLYQKEGLVALLANTKNALVSNGHIIIQTLHPYFLIQQEKPYRSQWLKDSWKGLSGNFTNGHSWYARTLGDWSKVLQEIPDVTISFEEITDEKNLPVSLLIRIQKLT